MAELTFGILGPLAAWCGDTHVRLPRPRERVLLAALLVNHGQVVPLDRLVQALWDEGPPPTARRQVAICVSRLRAAFAEAGAGKEVITTCPPGYRAGGLLDARCFEDYASQAHRARDAGQSAEAARLLRAGLSLWRGPALGGI